LKPERIALSGARDAHEVARRVLLTRLSEARRLADALRTRDKAALHDFRIACKRLRYALERFSSLAPDFCAIAERLAVVQDVLGEAHDRDVLLESLPAAMPATQSRLRAERAHLVEHAADAWNAFERLASFIGSQPSSNGLPASETSRAGTMQAE
jgi:CHAD domain-containing protein